VQGHALDATSSDPGLAGGLFAGWRFPAGSLRIQPELLARGCPWSQASLLGAGLVLASSTPLTFGGYAHAGMPWYEGPAWDAGALVEVGTLGAFRPGLRTGYVRSQAPHAKCGTCAQPAHPIVAASLQLAVVL